MTGDELRARTLAAVQRHPSPTRRAFRLRAGLLIAASIAVSLALFVLAGGVRTGPRSTSLVTGAVAGALVIAIASVAMGVVRRRSMLPRPGWQIALLVAVVPAALFAWKVMWSARYAGMMVDWPARPGFRCFFLTLGMGLAPLAALLAVYRRSEPLRPGVVGGALGVAVGAAAWVLLELWCPVAYPRHLLLGHVAPTLLLALLGALVGRSVLAMGHDHR